MLLKKQKLAKKPILTHCPGMSLRTEEYYSPDDLKCGDKIDIYGRICLIYSCDDFTKAWYEQNKGYTQVPLSLGKPSPNVKYEPVPGYMGYGTEEDSMGSVIALQPKAPKFDMQKMFK